MTLPNVRKLFTPDPGMTIAENDLDSADLRIVVAESGCRAMQAMLDAGLKPYVEVAKEYYRDPSITKSHPSYKLFKALCHATNYLGTASGVAPRVGLVVHEVDRIQKWYFQQFPEIRLWQQRVIADINTRKYVTNIFGNRRYFFDRIDQHAYNAGVAWIPQSTIGLLINRAWLRIHNEAPEIQPLLQVHDSLVVQYPTHLGAWAEQKILDCFKIKLPYNLPLIIPAGLKRSAVSWGDCQ